MMRRMLAAMLALSACGDSTGPAEDIDVTQEVDFGNSMISWTLRTNGSERVTGSWSAEWCTGGNFSFCYPDVGSLTGTASSGSSPTLSVALLNAPCPDGNLSATYSRTHDRLSGTVSFWVARGETCVNSGGTF